MIIAGFLKLILQYSDEELTWPAAMLLGTCMSITDAVEVVHILAKEGYSDKFITLLECEALLNDATGIIFYLLFS